MSWKGFGRSLAFAAAAAALFPAWALLTRPLLAGSAALSIYLVALAAIYVAGIAPRGRRIALGLVATVLGCGVLALAHDLGQVAIGAALVLGVGRSALLFQARPARAIFGEAILLGGGLALARFLSAPGLLGASLGIWAFFLIQSAFFLVGGVRERNPTPHLDPFDLAQTRLLATLEED